jgi:hypothetical protein
MANEYLKKQLLSLTITKDEKNTLQSLFKELDSKVLFNYRVNLFTKAGIDPKPLKKLKKAGKSLDLKAIRKIYLETFEKSLALNKLVALKFIKDQRAREKRKKDRENSEHRKKEAELLMQEKEKQDLLMQKSLENEKKLEKLRISSEKRRDLMKYYQEIDSPVKPMPLFKQIEENYNLHQQMPELERRKKELENKRMMFKPISLSEIREHAEKSKKLLEDLQHKRKAESCNLNDSKSKKLKTKFTEAILEYDRQSKEIEENKRKNPKQLLDKRKEYGKVISELYQPSLDRFKEQEMKLIKARLELPVRFKLRDSSMTESDSNCSRSVSVQPKKWKKNLMIPEPAEKKQGFKVDYLGQRRKSREKSVKINKSMILWEEGLEKLSDRNEKMSFLKKKAKIMDSQVKNLEIRLNSKRLNIDMAEQVNDLIINSIRAKLSYLE